MSNGRATAPVSSTIVKSHSSSDVRCRPGGQHREVVHEVLARGDQPGTGLSPATLEPTAHDAHRCLLCSSRASVRTIAAGRTRESP